MKHHIILFTLITLVALGALAAALNAASGTAVALLPIVMGEGQATPINATYTPPPPITGTPTATATATGTPAFTPTPAATATATATATSTPTATATTTPPPPDGANVICAYDGPAQICVWVSKARPQQKSNVTVSGRLLVAGEPVSGATMHTEWAFKSAPAQRDCLTDAAGIGKCTRNIRNAAAGYRVNVLVEIVHDGATYSAETWFVPRK